jgi:hypothetical protein
VISAPYPDCSSAGLEVMSLAFNTDWEPLLSSFRNHKSRCRVNRRTFASWKREKSEVFRFSSGSAKSPFHAGKEQRIAIMDGEKILRNLSHQALPDWMEVLDLTHALEKLRFVDQLHYGNERAADGQ